MTGFRLYHSYVIMNVINRNQSLVKSEIRYYFITIANIDYYYYYEVIFEVRLYIYSIHMHVDKIVPTRLLQ